MLLARTWARFISSGAGVNGISYTPGKKYSASKQCQQTRTLDCIDKHQCPPASRPERGRRSTPRSPHPVEGVSRSLVTSMRPFCCVHSHPNNDRLSYSDRLFLSEKGGERARPQWALAVMCERTEQAGPARSERGCLGAAVALAVAKLHRVCFLTARGFVNSQISLACLHN